MLTAHLKIFGKCSLKYSGGKWRGMKKTAEEELNNQPFPSQTEGLPVWVRSSISKTFSNLCSLKGFFSGRHEECEVWPPFFTYELLKEALYVFYDCMFQKAFLSLSQCTTKVVFISFQLCIGVHIHCQTHSFSVQVLMTSISRIPSIWPVAKPTDFSLEMFLKHTPVSLAHLPIFYSIHVLTDSSHFFHGALTHRHSPSPKLLYLL